MEKEVPRLVPRTLDTATSRNPENNDKEETLEEARKYHEETLREALRKYAKKDAFDHVADFLESSWRVISRTPRQDAPRPPQLTPEEEQSLWQEHLAYKRRQEERKRRKVEIERREEEERKRRAAEPLPPGVDPILKTQLEAVLQRGSRCFWEDPDDVEDRKRLRRLGIDPSEFFYPQYHISIRKRMKRKERVWILKMLGFLFVVCAGLRYWITGKLFRY